MEMTELRERGRALVEDPRLDYHQRVFRLAGLAEEALPYPELGNQAQAALDKRLVCDMFEGPAPYRPRYVLPDYALLLKQGSAHLELASPDGLDDALATLLTAYLHVPSITGYPVWLGDVDTLLEPYTVGVEDAALERAIRLFWRTLDRVLPDAFVHANLGPDDSRIGRAVLAAERSLRQVVPNLTLKVDPDRTPDGFLLDAISTVFDTAKPHFVAHRALVADLGERYGVVSCYNSLKAGGGSHTLVRLNLKEAVVRHSGGIDSFLARTLPIDVELTAQVIEARVRYLVEEARFYESSWLAREGLIELDRFSAMFGVYGTAEAVELLLEREGIDARYGHDPIANETAQRLMARVADLVAARPMPYCEGGGGRCFLHAQSGIDSDEGVTAGTRVPIGREPALLEHLNAVAPLHRFFAAGVSDIVHLDSTARTNPQAVLDLMRGAFAQGMREFTFNLDDNEFIRITGYLVRKSDLEHLDAGARHSSTYLGAGSVERSHVLDRVSQRIRSRESSPR